MRIIISPRAKPDKKCEARIDGKKSIHFGAKGYEDFTYTMTLRGRTDILTDTQTTKTGIIP